MSYPPEPWHLVGRMHVSVWLVPAGELPPLDVPAAYPIVVAGRCVVGTAVVDYQAGSVLTYREVLACVLVRQGRRIRPNIWAIWVDDASSLEGGRALWGIPKQLADLTHDDGSFTARADDRTFVTARTRKRLGLPLRWPVAFSVAQSLTGRLVVTPVRGRSRLELSSTTWEVEAAGPLGVLHRHRPLGGFTLRDFRLRFGSV